jgi:hypothetical protein
MLIGYETIYKVGLTTGDVCAGWNVEVCEQLFFLRHLTQKRIILCPLFYFGPESFLPSTPIREGRDRPNSCPKNQSRRPRAAQTRIYLCDMDNARDFPDLPAIL